MEVLLPKCVSVFGRVSFTLNMLKRREESWNYSVCPSIWLIELDKLDKRVAAKVAREAFENSNLTTLPPTTTIGNAVQKVFVFCVYACKYLRSCVWV